MGKERLSKLQKWILEECYKNTTITRRHVRMFFGKWFHPGKYNFSLDDTPSLEAMGMLKNTKKEEAPDRKYFTWHKAVGPNGKEYERFGLKEEYRSTKAIEVTISRMLKNMKKKGLIQEGWMTLQYSLTKKGLLMLTGIQKVPLVNFKEYREKVEDDYGSLVLGDIKKIEETTKKIMKRGTIFMDASDVK